MKTIISFLILMTLPMFGAQTVMVDTNAVITSPLAAKFFSANSNAMNTAVAPSPATTNSIPGLVTDLGAINTALGVRQAGSQALSNLTANPSLYQATNAALTALASNPSLYQATNANLTALAANGSLYQATNAALTTLVAGGTSTNFFAGDKTYKQITTNMVPGLVGDVSNLQTAINARQTGSSVLTNVAALTSGTTSNFLSGLGTFVQVTTNYIPGLVTDVSAINTALALKQIGSAALTNLTGGDGSALTNVARIGLGQPEVSGVAFNGVSGTKTAGLAQNIGTNDFSVWVRAKITRNTSSAIYPALVKLSPDGTYTGRVFDLYFQNSKLWCAIYGATSADYNNFYVDSVVGSYGGSISDVVFTRAGTNASLYINGILQTPSASSSAGTPPTWAGSLTSTRVDVGGYIGAATACAYESPIYRTAVFNRALSQADVTSLVNNGIDPADQWGTQTQIVGFASPSYLNGGFETNSLNAAGTWGASSSGGTGTIDTTGTNSVSGSNAFKMTLDASGNGVSLTANNGVSTLIPANARFRLSFWAKDDAASPTVGKWRADLTGQNGAYTTPNLTSTYTYYSGEIQTTVASGLTLVRGAIVNGAIQFIDNIELTRIGAILDLDFTTGYGTNVTDRSSNSLNATNYGGVSWTMPVNAINTGTVTATNVTTTYLTVSQTETVGNEVVLTNQTVVGTITSSLLTVTNSATLGSLTVVTNLAVAGTETVSIQVVTNSVTQGSLTVRTNAIIAGTATISLLTVTNSTTLGDLTVRTNIAGLAANIQSLLVTNASVFRGQITTASNILYSTLPITVSSAVTNWIVDFSWPMNTLQVTTNVFLVSSAAKPASSTNFVRSVVRLRGGANAQTLGVNASWIPIGTAITSIPANKIVILEMTAWGNNETNVTVEFEQQP